MAKILAIDLDGTLFYPKGKRHLISKKNIAFLRKFIDAGNNVVLVTSRLPDFCDKIVSIVDRKMDMICLCGAYVKHNGVVVKNTSIPNDVIKQILEDVKKSYNPIGYFLQCEGEPIIVCPHVKIGPIMKRFYLWVYKSICGIYREEIDIDPDKFYQYLDSKRIYNVKSYYGLGRKARKANAQANKEIRLKYPMIESSWMGIVLEFDPKGCNKGDSLLDYIEYLGADKNDVCVIGDSGNDISMFNAFHENSYCMKHAYPSVKKYAKYKVSRVYKLEKYLFERSQNE